MFTTSRQIPWDASRTPTLATSRCRGRTGCETQTTTWDLDGDLLGIVSKAVYTVEAFTEVSTARTSYDFEANVYRIRPFANGTRTWGEGSVSS